MTWIRVGDLAVADDVTTAGLIDNTASATRGALDRVFLPGLSVKAFGAVGDGVTDDSVAFKAAYNTGAATGKPFTLHIPDGTYHCPSLKIRVEQDGVSIVGSGGAVVRTPEAFDVAASDFTVRGIRFECINFTQLATAIGNRTSNGVLTRSISNITVENCVFVGYFYATYFAAATYADASTPGFVPMHKVSDVSINYCRSVAPSGVNAGHFQHLAVWNAQAIGCTTYNGQNASSYNYIGNNGYLRVIGCYDDGNPYAATEIENSSGPATVQGNTFLGDIWVDDSSDIAVAGNTITGAGVRVTIQHHDVRNVTITGNVAKFVLLTSFGTSHDATKVMDNIIVTGNVLNGDGNYGVNIGSADSRMRTIIVSDNIMAGGFTSGAVGITRNANLKALIAGNQCGGQNIVISSTGGVVNLDANVNATVSGTRDALYESWTSRSSNGVQLESANGTKYRLYVSDSGTVQTVAA